MTAWRIGIWVLMGLLWASVAWAGEKAYVSVDRSNLRSGPGVEYASIGVVASGQELDIQSAVGDWIKVNVAGKTGWIIRKATTSTAPVPVVVRGLERKLADVRDENERLTRELRGLSDSRQDLELQASQLKANVALLTAANEELKSWRTVMWVGLGLLVLLIGWGLGFIAGTFRRQAENKRFDTLIRDAARKNEMR